MKNTKQTEIEIWYNFNIDNFRVINKNKPYKKHLFYDGTYRWKKSSTDNRVLEILIFLGWEKIGEL